MNLCKTSVAAALKAASAVGPCVLSVALLAGCGQRGPLTLPSPPSAAASVPAAGASRP
jgi:predicted small lipoprotein YifL